MTEKDANGWIKGMGSAPKDEPIQVVIPYDGDCFEHAIAYWLESEDVSPEDGGGYWDGEWRHLDTDSDLPTTDPTHWKLLDLPGEYEMAEAVA